jgi:O-acetyl-ADP-ribose deacetylase (regulator of RNase III)
MGGGVAGAIKRVGGVEIEKEAVSKAPIDIGKTVATISGSLPCRYVIHAPTMKRPAMRIDIENVKLATRAALETGIKLNLKSIAIPGMGTGVGGVQVDKAAEVIVSLAKEYEDKFEKIFLIDRNEEMIESFKKFL